MISTKISVTVPQKVRNRSTTWPNNSTSGHIPEKLNFLLQKQMLIHVQCCSVHYLEGHGNCLHVHQLMNRYQKCGTYTQWNLFSCKEYKEIMKYAGKLVRGKKKQQPYRIRLLRPRKTKTTCFHWCVGLSIKYLDLCV